jgi:hypothetical protein
MNISVLIPSRGNAHLLAESIHFLLSRAANPKQIEIVLRMDNDDPAAIVFPSAILGPSLGYTGNHIYYEECYRRSTGDLLLAWNDDAEMVTPRWDELYIEALKNTRFGVACADIDSGSDGRYGWALPMVRRDLCEACGQFCTGTGTIDRIFDAYARLSGRGVNAPVSIAHHWQPLQPGSERQKMYNYASGHWDEMNIEWDTAAMDMVARMRSKMRDIWSAKGQAP